MKRSLPLIVSVAILSASVGGYVQAQTSTSPGTTTPAPGTNSTTSPSTGTTAGTTTHTTGTATTVDPQSLSTGFRASKIIGANVTNEAGDTIGSVDDLIVSQDEKVPAAILSVGGFLGVGSKLVAVPYASLTMANQKLTLPGATKDSLKNLPSYSYTK